MAKSQKNNKEKFSKSNEGNLAYPEYNDRKHLDNNNQKQNK